ncbi:MAG: hypothetical protein R2746_01385 [Acidimicrobiales bacterium]
MLAGIDTSAGSDGDHDRALIAILAAAHAGELAAAYAYRGHWRSRWGAARWDDRREIQRIEAAEWHHRRLVHGLLAELGSGPVRWRELLMATIGRLFGALCFVGGRFGPMYAAGRLEAMNVGQYVDAAAHARAGGRAEMAELLDEMVAEEARHEEWFGDQVRGHPLLPLVAAVGGWRPPATPTPISASADH